MMDGNTVILIFGALGWAFFSIILLILIMGVFNRWLPKSIGCHLFGWHISDDTKLDFDGFNATSKCKRCNKHILMDSQGNWF